MMHPVIAVLSTHNTDRQHSHNCTKALEAATAVATEDSRGSAASRSAGCRIEQDSCCVGRVRRRGPPCRCISELGAVRVRIV